MEQNTKGKKSDGRKDSAKKRSKEQRKKKRRVAAQAKHQVVQAILEENNSLKAENMEKKNENDFLRYKCGRIAKEKEISKELDKRKEASKNEFSSFARTLFDKSSELKVGQRKKRLFKVKPFQPEEENAWDNSAQTECNEQESDSCKRKPAIYHAGSIY